MTHSHAADLQTNVFFFWPPPVLQIVLFFVSGFNLLLVEALDNGTNF